MLTLKLDKKFIARSRLRFALGAGMIGSGIAIVNLLTFAKVWEQTFIYYGIPPILVYILFPVGFILSSWYLGMYYDTRGYWGEETSHSNANLNPEFSEICKDVKEIKEMLLNGSDR